MHRTGFEPVLQKESDLESDALDHSANDALKFQRMLYVLKYRCQQDLNLRGQSPMDFKSIALTTRP